MPESQWSSFIVADVLNLAESLLADDSDGAGESPIEALDVSTQSIEPISLCPYTELAEVSSFLNKKIDFALGLTLPNAQARAVKASGAGINQTAGYAGSVPLFLHLEVKKRGVSDDPMVQLGVWVAAEFRRRELRGFDMRMPALAVEVEEDAWRLYVVYDDSQSAAEGRRVITFAGPVPIGNTETV